MVGLGVVGSQGGRVYAEIRDYWTVTTETGGGRRKGPSGRMRPAAPGEGRWAGGLWLVAEGREHVSVEIVGVS